MILGGFGALWFVLDEPFDLGACARPPFPPLAIGGRHCPRGGPKLGFKVEGGAGRLFTVVSFSHAVQAS